MFTATSGEQICQSRFLEWLGRMQNHTQNRMRRAGRDALLVPVTVQNPDVRGMTLAHIKVPTNFGSYGRAVSDHYCQKKTPQDDALSLPISSTHSLTKAFRALRD